MSDVTSSDGTLSNECPYREELEQAARQGRRRPRWALSLVIACVGLQAGVLGWNMRGAQERAPIKAKLAELQAAQDQLDAQLAKVEALQDDAEEANRASQAILWLLEQSPQDRMVIPLEELDEDTQRQLKEFFEDLQDQLPAGDPDLAA